MNGRASSVQLMSVQIRSDKVVNNYCMVSETFQTNCQKNKNRTKLLGNDHAQSKFFLAPNVMIFFTI